jgi:uncharacterized protein (TIGR03083 family)
MPAARRTRRQRKLHAMEPSPDLNPDADEPRPQPRRSLQILEAELHRLGDDLLRLTPAQLELPSNLPGWRIYDLGVHVTRVCALIRQAIQRGSSGDQTPAFGDAAKPVEERIRSLTVAEWVELQQDAYGQITRVVAELTDEQLQHLTFPHPQGQRSLRWFCTQLLTEMAFHRWDLARSLGVTAPLEEALAMYLLNFMLDLDEPLFGLRRGVRATETFVVASDGWHRVLTTTPAGTQVTDRGDSADARTDRPAQDASADARTDRPSQDASADARTDRPSQDAGRGHAPAPRITAQPGWLVLALYGRVRVDTSPFGVVGPADTADRFAAIFGPAAP